jgi:D-lactate dehydrogenase
VREQNFDLTGLVGFNMHGKTIGVVGTGKIGAALARILNGFGCKLLGYDVVKNPDCLALGMAYVDLPTLLASSDIVSLHAPLTPETRHMINADSIARMKHGAMLINTGRGGLVDTTAVIEALKTGRLGYVGMDVYEEEDKLFFQDLSNTIIPDDEFQRLLGFPNVVVTGHMAFLTREALGSIADTTLSNISAFARTGAVNPANEVKATR